MINSTHECAVIFRGELVEGVDIHSTKERLVSAFKLPPAQVERLLNSSGTTLKKGLSPEQAEQYRKKLHALGLICHISTKSSTNPATTTEATPTSATAVTKLDTTLVERAFEGEFEAVPIKRKYYIGIVATAVAMMLLPLIYLGIITLLGYGTLWHLTSNPIADDHLGNMMATTLLHIIPAIVSILLLLFLIKPIFAPPVIERRPIVLDPVRHRRFIHFVEQLCDKIGAPKPTEIHVDSYVNASARLKHGALSNQLILTVGMPLISTLNSRELAGVLAHELGHFAQRYGMKLGYIINTINYWFYRVVHERDRWDDLLDQWLDKNSNWYVTLTGHFAHLCIRLTRGLLHGLMLAGILVSRFMSRQMEFDADLYAARISGSQQFRQTTLKVRIVARAFSNAHHRNMAAWNEGHVTDNLPQLTANFADKLPATIRQKLNSDMKNSESKRWDTHPSDAERITHVEQEFCSGIFKLEVPAYLLLHDYERLNRLATLNYYQNEKIRIIEIQFVAPEKILESASHRSEGQSTLEHYFNGQFHNNRILPLYGTPDQNSSNSSELQALVDQLRQQAPEAKALNQQHETLESRLAWLRVAYAFIEAGIPLDHRAFNLPASDTETVNDALRRSLSDVNGCESRLRHHQKIMGRRLSYAVGLAYNSSDNSNQQQIIALWRALSGLGKIRETLSGLTCYGFVLSELYSYNNDEDTKSFQVGKSYIRLCTREIDHIKSVLATIPDPFASKERGSLGLLLQQWIEERRSGARNEIEVCLATKQAIIDAVIYLNGRITGALAIHAALAERSSGIKPIRLVE